MPGSVASGDRSAIIERFEGLVAARRGQPLALAEICEATGVSERTLRIHCRAYLGMSPVRYLWLQRMQLAREALMRADPTWATVTAIATEYGFCELGRFSVEYRELFGESPSVSLRRPPEDSRTPRSRASDMHAGDLAPAL